MSGEEDYSPIDALREAIAFYEADAIPPEQVIIETTLNVINAVEAAAFVRGYEAALSATDDEAHALYEQHLRAVKPGDPS